MQSEPPVVLVVRRVVNCFFTRGSLRVQIVQRQKVLHRKNRKRGRASHVLSNNSPHDSRFALRWRDPGGFFFGVGGFVVVHAFASAGFVTSAIHRWPSRARVVDGPSASALRVALPLHVHAVFRRGERVTTGPGLNVLRPVRGRAREHPAPHFKRGGGEPAPASLIRFVPSPRGVRVVAAGTAHGVVRVRGRRPELAVQPGRVRHPLDPQPQNPQILKHGLHALRDHPEILAAHELPGALGERREGSPRVFPPQRVLAFVEVVV
mmetsp:Transcript_12300/g.40913  ORF Transcript_12300/g.40913 Transcript_12300/m.40913 type:complete len:264 (-) Transcript_12300:3010-3801(-)